MTTAPLPEPSTSEPCPICEQPILPDVVRCAVCGWHRVPTEGVAGGPLHGRELWILAGAFAAVYAVVLAIVATSQ